MEITMWCQVRRCVSGYWR